jgi:hypothetical protein
MLSTARSTITAQVASVAEPMCGNVTTYGSATSVDSSRPMGSRSKTSSPAECSR